MLKNLLARLKSYPAVKQALGRGDPPEDRALYDALQEIIRNEDMADFISRAAICQGIDRPFVDGRLDWYIDFTKELTLALSRSARGALTSWSKKNLLNWCHNNSANAQIDSETVRELGLIEHIRPEEQTTLYRGMLFQNWQLEDPRWGDEAHPKSGHVFIDALKHGHTELLVAFNNPSSWTTSEATADRFAKRRPAVSQYAAMANWLQNADKHIEGKLGVILSGSFIPRDIICDVSKIEIGHLLHGDEGEMIVHRGNYNLTIHAIYTEQGPIEPSAFAEWLSKMNIAGQ